MKWSVLVIITVCLMAGCYPNIDQVHEEKGAEAPVTVISVDEAVGELPCFKCHSYKEFSGKPQEGIFSHELHRDTGYHCNQCHNVRGHYHVAINKDICSECHEVQEITLERTVLPSPFNHDLHATMYNSCKECHPKLFLMSAGASRITMNDIENGAYCGACHNGESAFPSSECSRCHNLKDFKKELAYKVEDIGDVTFSHKSHTAKFSCKACHPIVFGMKKTAGKMTMDDMYEGKFCGVCHNGRTAPSVEDCEKCHQES
jgi:c(7)-type cytochrome triheme protein